MPKNNEAESSGGFMTKRNVQVAPGRPIFSFSGVGNVSRKKFPSKWDDAEKWLVGYSSPAHHLALKPSESSKVYKRCINNNQPQQGHLVFAEKSNLVVVTEEKVFEVPPISSFQGGHNPLDLDHHHKSGPAASTHVPLTKPKKEGFLCQSPTGCYSKRDAAAEVVEEEVKHRDIGTEMSPPLGSCTSSRCNTPFKSPSPSPARHNTPADRSGRLPLTTSTSTTTTTTNNNSTTFAITQLQDCHLAKLQLGSQFASVWSSKEEEEENVSKSLRHFDITNEIRKSSFSDSRACCTWEEENTKCCLRFQREEAKIQAWVNLQNAKAEAQLRNLEVKIEKMRSNLEKKLMKKMGIVHRKAEEMRGAALQLHQRSDQSKGLMKEKNLKSSDFSARSSSCGCFPACNIIHHQQLTSLN